MTKSITMFEENFKNLMKTVKYNIDYVTPQHPVYSLTA